MTKYIDLNNYSNLETLLDDLDNQNDPEIDIPATFHKYLNMKAKQYGIPYHGTFELTPLCNLDCKMCYVHLDKSQMTGKPLLTTEQWKDLMSQAINAGMMDAAFTGGECLSYPGFDELYLFLESMGIRTTILTNGLLLSEERIEFFKKHQPKGIQLTVYGCDDDEYESVTGKRCFSQINNAIERLKDAKLSFSIAITPSRFMKNGGKDLLNFVHSLGIPYTVNTLLFTPRSETGRNNDIIDIETDNYIELHLVRKSLIGTKPVPCEKCDLPILPKSGSIQKGLLCSAGSSNFFIGWDGRMAPCSCFVGCDQYPLRDSFSSSWHIVREYCRDYTLPAECSECTYNRICPSCVMAHLQDAPMGHASPKICHRAQRIVESGLVKLDKLVSGKE